MAPWKEAGYRNTRCKSFQLYFQLPVLIWDRLIKTNAWQLTSCLVDEPIKKDPADLLQSTEDLDVLQYTGSGG